MSDPLVVLMRGDLREGIHRGDLAVVSADGELRFSVGDPCGKIAFWRSSAKPFQAMPLIASGAAGRLGLVPEDIALMAASHGGEPVHVERVSSLLERAGHGVADLECGAREPIDAVAARALARRGEQPSALHNTCSGKHVGMLALADQLDVPFAGYRLPEHPVQRALAENVARFTGGQLDELVIGLDGCGVPCFGISVFRMALAYARLMAPPDDVPGPFRAAAAAVREAMMQAPYLVAGRDRLDSDLMRALPRAIVSKEGAGGVQCIGLPGGIGLALKLEDGASPPIPGVAALAALRQLGKLDGVARCSLEQHARPEIRSAAGQLAGEARPVFELLSRT